MNHEDLKVRMKFKRTEGSLYGPPFRESLMSWGEKNAAAASEELRAAAKIFNEIADALENKA